MANKKPKQNKPKTGLARCLELASNTFLVSGYSVVCSVYCGIFYY